MATITVRDLDESTRSKLRIRAARNGRSMEAEVRHILEQATSAEDAEYPALGSRIRALVGEIGGADDLVPLIPPRPEGDSRRMPDLDGGRSDGTTA